MYCRQNCCQHPRYSMTLPTARNTEELVNRFDELKDLVESKQMESAKLMREEIGEEVPITT